MLCSAGALTKRGQQRQCHSHGQHTVTECACVFLSLQRLEAHPKVRRVYYPGLASHPDHDIAKQQVGRAAVVSCFCSVWLQRGVCAVFANDAAVVGVQLQLHQRQQLQTAAGRAQPV